MLYTVYNSHNRSICLLGDSVIWTGTTIVVGPYAAVHEGPHVDIIHVDLFCLQTDAVWCRSLKSLYQRPPTVQLIWVTFPCYHAATAIIFNNIYQQVLGGLFSCAGFCPSGDSILGCPAPLTHRPFWVTCDHQINSRHKADKILHVHILHMFSGCKKIIILSGFWFKDLNFSTKDTSS